MKTKCPPLKPKPPSPPAHLCAATRRWWAQAVADFELEAHHLRLLTLAGEAWDGSRRANAVVRAQGQTYTDRFGQPKERPEVAIEDRCTLRYARLMREVGLDIDPPADVRPPRLAGTGG